MQMTLPVTASLHAPNNADCPFCPGKEEGPWTTHPGKTNDAKILRSIMKDPSKLGEKQSNARPKDGAQDRQSADDPRPTYDTKSQGVIYEHYIHGPYGNQAHHAISGKQILEDEPIETLIDKSHGKIEKDTGYSVNNAANGVCLTSYPKKYSKKNAPLLWSEEDEEKKCAIAYLPMEAGKGQVHIGEHDHPGDPDDETVAPIHHTSYPQQARDFLQELYDLTVFRWSRECPFCNENAAVKDPLPPPYRINQRLDSISKRLINHITTGPTSWVYFISEYAKQLHYTNCTHPRSRSHSH